MKAMMGSTADARTLRLLDEIRVLRARVAELEDALATAREVREQLDDDAVQVDEGQHPDEEPAVLEGTAAAR